MHAFLWRAAAATAAFMLLVTSGPDDARSRPTKVVDTFNLVPGGGGKTFILQGPVAMNGGTVVFCDRSDENKYDVWTAGIDGRGKAKVIPEGKPMPKEEFGTFKQTCELIAVKDGNLVFIGDGCAGCGHGKGIFRMPAGGGDVVSLVDITMNFPGSDVKFTPDWGPGGDFNTDGKNVVFSNGQAVWAVPLGGGPVNEVASLADTGRSPPDPSCCMFGWPSLLNLADRVFLHGRNFFGDPAMMTVNVDGRTNTFRFMVRGAGITHLPDTPRGYRAQSFLGADTGAHFVFVAQSADFTGQGRPEIRGIYSRNPSTGTIVKLVDDRTRVPGRAAKFTLTWGPFFPPISAKNGLLVFGSDDSKGKHGIYMVPEGGGDISKIVATGEPIGNGFRVGSLGFTRRQFDGITVVFTVSYAGNGFVGNGVYATSVGGP